MAEVASDLAASLACPVCLELPAGEVHQCFEGHCYCVDCWRRLCHPRRCPECRDPIPLRNRSRAQEARVAALPAVCDHCDHTTTRRGMAEHLRACQQRPTTCTGGARSRERQQRETAERESQRLYASLRLYACQRLYTSLKLSLCSTLLSHSAAVSLSFVWL